MSLANKSGHGAARGTCPGHGRATGGTRPPPTVVHKIHTGLFGPLLTDPVAKTVYGFSAPCLQCVHWMTSRSQTWPKMCLCELMNWFNCLPNLRAAKSNKLKFTILWSHLQGDNTATVYFVRCWSESGENYSPYIILIIIIIIKILLIGNTDGCFAPLTCTIVSARLAADSAGQGVLIPWRQNWIHSHNRSQQLHAVAREFNNRHGCSMAASVGGSAGPDDASQRRGRSSRGGRRYQGAWKLLRDCMADVPSLSPREWGGRWEQPLCSFWKMCKQHP